MKHVLLFLLALGFSTSLFSQDMTLWRIYGDPNNHDSDNVILVPCAEAYYLIADENEDIQTSVWSIKNEGTATLELQLPISFAVGSSANLSITSQPGTNSLAPGEETQFTIAYDVTSDEVNGYLTIESNDLNNPFCGISFGAGRIIELCFFAPNNLTESKNTQSSAKAIVDCPPACIQCVCMNGVIAENCISGFGWIPTITDGLVIIGGGGLPLGPRGRSCADIMAGNLGDMCTPIEISDPCLCENIVENGAGDMVFRDILQINTTLTSVFVQNIGVSGSFMDIIGQDYSFVIISDEDLVKPGIQFTFYRAPGTTVNIVVEGEEWMSDVPCLELADCESIPTVPQWMLFILALILTSVSLVYINKNVIQKA